MGAAAHERWIRTEGVMVAPGLRPAQVQQHLTEAAVVARLEWYAATEHLLSVTVATDESGHVAITRPDGGVVPGPALVDLVRQLGEAFDADVLMEGAEHLAGAAPAGNAAAPGGTDPAPARTDVGETPDPEWADHDARTVILTRLPQYTLPLHADLLARPLSVLEHQGYRLVMTAGPGRELGLHGWEDEAYPVLRLQVDAEDRTAMLLTGGEDVATFSWTMHDVMVHGHVATPDPALRTMAEAVLGDTADAEAFAEVLGADVEAVTAALATPGPEGMAAFVEALGLPPVVTAVLEGRTDPVDVPGVVVHEPRGLGNAVGRSLSYMLADDSVPGAGFWNAYRRTTLERPWAVRALAAVEVLTGSALLLRAARATPPVGPGRRVGALVGVTLLVDALADLALAEVVRSTSRTVR